MSSKKQTFTEALKKLETIVEKLEDPNLDLEEGLSLLEQGVSLHKFCQSKLTEANVKINDILKTGTEEKDE